MASRHEIVSIDFRANASKANPAMDSLREAAKGMRTEIEKTQAAIANGKLTGMAQAELDKLGSTLAAQERKLHSFENAMNSLAKGVGTLGRAIDAFNAGTLNQMSAAFQKASYNAAENAKKALLPGSKDYQKNMAELDALQQKNLENLAKYKLRTEQMLKSIGEGGKISSTDLKQEADGIQELMKLLPHMGHEWMEYYNILQRVNEATKQQAENERRLSGAIVDANDARERSAQLSRKGADDAARQRREAADEIALRDKNIAALKKEQEAKSKDVAGSAALVQAKDKEIDKQRKVVASIQDRIDNEEKNEKATKKTIDKLNEQADTWDTTAKKTREAVETMKDEVKGLDDELKQVTADLEKMGPAAQAAAPAAKKEETQAIKEKTEAKKEEVKADEEVIETQEKEAETADTLKKKHEALVKETRDLIEERKKLTTEREGVVQTLEAEAAAAEKAANAFASLSKKEAEAMLKERQAVITKGEDGKFSYTNPENAQHFLIESMRKVNPANAKGSALSLDGEGVAKVRAMFMERFGLQSDDDALAAIRGLLTGGENSLIKMGVMNNGFGRIDVDSSKASLYSRIIKDLTEVINGEVKAIDGESEAKKRLEQIDTRLLEVKEKIDANDKESMKIWKQRQNIQRGLADSTEEETEKTENLNEARKKYIELLKQTIEAHKGLTAEQAAEEIKSMKGVSTVGYKGGKLDMSNPEEVQNFLITRAQAIAGRKGRGAITLKGAQADRLFDAFATRYGWSGDSATAKDILKEIIQGKGGLFKGSGFASFSGAEDDRTVTIKQDIDAVEKRGAKLTTLTAIAEGAAKGIDKVTEATKDETDAIRIWENEVERRHKRYKELSDDLSNLQNELKDLKQKNRSLPEGDVDSEEIREANNARIAEISEALPDKKTAAEQMKKSWQGADTILKAMKGATLEDTQATENNTAAQNQSAEATERATKSKRGRKKATMEATDATKEQVKVEGEAIRQEEKLSEEDQKRQELLKKKQELETKIAEKEGEIAKKQEEAAGLEVKASNNRADAKRKTEELAGAHQANADAMGRESEKMKKLQEQQAVLTGQLDGYRSELADVNRQIDENAEKRTKAQQKEAQAQKLTVDAMNDAVKVLEERNRAIAPESKEWQENTRLIQQYRAEIDRLKNQPVLQMMTERMGNIRNLSADALTETRKFWEQMAAGAERGSHKLEVYEGNLRAIAEEERQRSQQIQAPMRGRLNNLAGLSTADLAETKRYWQAMRDGLDQTTAAYKKAELAVKALENEENRRKANAQAQYINDRMRELNSLSISGLAEVKRYWQAMADGARKGSDEARDAANALRQINEVELKATRQQVRPLFGDLSKKSGEEIRAAIDAGKKLIDTYESGSPAAERLAQAILNAEEYMKGYGLEAERAARREAAAIEEAAARRREQDQLMRQQLDQGSSLSESALKAQQQYWQRLIDDPKTATESLAGYRYELERTMELQEQQAAKTRDERAARLGGTLSNYSEAEVREAIEAGKQLIQTYKVGSDEATALAKNIVVAEEYVKEYGVEAQRAAVREAKALADAAQKRKETDALMETQLSKNMSLSRTALQAQQQYWQRLIDDPKTAVTSLQQYEANLQKVKTLLEAVDLDEVQAKGKDALRFFRGNTENASADLLKENLEALKKYRDSLPRKTHADEIDEINGYIEKTGEAAKMAAGEMMSLADAKKVAGEAGKDGFSRTQQEMQLATKAIEQQRDAVIQTIKAKRDSGTATDAEEKELADLTKMLRDLKFEQDNFNMSQAKMQALMEKPTNAVNLDELRAAIKRADAELHRMEGSLGDNSEEYKKFAEQVKAAKNTLKEMEGQAKATATAFEKAWSRLKTYVVMYVGANAALQRLMGTMGDLMDLSDKMGEVRKTTGFTADEVGRLSESLKKLDTRTTITGLLDLSVAAGQLGLKTQEDVEGFTIAANKLMVALPEMGREGATEMLKVALATGEIDKIRRQMEQGIIDGSSATAVAMEKVGSTIDRLRATSAATAPAITDFVKRVGAVGAQSGISIDQVAALGSTVDALGMRVEMSATALSRMVPAIKNNAFAIGQVIGKTEEYIRTQFAEGKGMNVILDIFDAIKKSGKQSADDIEAMFGGSMQEIMKELNQQGARAGIVFAGLSQNVDELRRQLGVAAKAYEENIAIQQEYNKMNETTAAKWERLKNELEEMFVGDETQRFLGAVIDGLRGLVNLISGNVKPALQWLSTAIKTVITAWSVFKLGLGEGLFYKLAAGLKSMGQSIALMGMYIKDYLVYQWQLIRAKDEEAKATVRATMAQRGLNKEMMANVWGAVVVAVGMVVYKLYEYVKASKEAAAEAGRFSQKVYEEQQALNSLFEPLNKSNLAQEERSKLISEINSKYSKYLGYMLSETTSAVQLADAHALIAKRIREEAYERRIAEQERKVQEAHEEDVNAAYAKMTDRLRSGARGSADVQAMADMLKGVVDGMMGQIRYAYDDSDNIFKGKTSYFLDPKVKAAIDNGIDRLVVDGKLSRDNVSLIQKAVYKYTVEAKSQHDEMMKTTANVRSDLRNIQGAIQNDLTRTLNGLVGNMISFAKQQGSPAPQQTPGPWAPQPQQQGGTALTPFWKQGTQQQGTGWGMGSGTGGRQQEQAIQRAPKDWKPDIDEKDVEQVRRFVKNQEDLRGAIAANAENMSDDMKDVYESWKVSETELDRLRKLVADSDKKNNPDGGGNPYGNFTVMDSYDKWSADALVDRKKQMLEYVKAMANGADVQAILSQDKKFMDEATRKGIKNVRDAIEWYNTERLKIQEELADRHLTNEGGWANPAKSKSRRPRQPMSESAIAQLEEYYAWRKEETERQRTEEGISEAEFNRRMESLEQEHLQKRADLRKSFTSQDKQYVEQFRKWWASVRELDEVEWELIDAEWKVAIKRDRDYNEMKAAKDLSAMRAIVVKQLNAIEDIIAKERPFNGITDNLEANLTKMGILFADLDKMKAQALAEGKDTSAIDALYGKDRSKRLSFILGESENSFSSTVEDVMARMADAGMEAWAEEIRQSPKMQEALMAQLHQTYDQIQEAIKKEASLMKKQAEVMWNNILLPGGDGKTTVKDAFEQAIAQLGIDQGRVSRANSLIGAGVQSERVADKLAIKQMQLQLSMQEHYYNLIRKQGMQRIKDLERQIELAKEEHDIEKQKRLEQDKQHVDMSLRLAMTKEQNELLKQQEDIIARTEESQNRLYTQLKEWGDLLASGMRDVFEASNAGNAEYYNELAKMNLTGKGGPGAGTYVVIENEGTSDATAHYEYLDERAALERQREIEQQNAQAEAWKKLWDDLNNKMSEQITDWMNAALQDQAIEANTAELTANVDALSSNTEAVVGLTGAILGKKESGEGSEYSADGSAEGGKPAATQSWQMTDEDKTRGIENMTEMKQAENDIVISKEMEKAEMLAEIPGYTPPPTVPPTDEQIALATEKQEALYGEIANLDDLYTNKFVENQLKMQKATKSATDQEAKNTQSSFAKMAAACNLYGIAYQTMSNDNLSTAQKVQMFALQAAGQAAISALTMNLVETSGKTTVQLPGILGKLLGEMPYPAAMAAYAGVTALMGTLMALATSAVTKSKSQITQITGASASAGRLATGMMTYAEGNVNEFTDPSTLTPGRQYNVDGADGRTYRARYMGTNPSTHLTNGPEFHLAGERGREMIIDAGTTRQITMNENEIWHAIQTLSAGGRMPTTRRRGRGVRAFADGNVEDFEEMGSVMGDGGDSGLGTGFTPEQAAAFQSSLDRNNELLERALSEGIHARFDVYGKGGLIDSYDTGKKTVTRHGERY